MSDDALLPSALASVLECQFSFCQEATEIIPVGTVSVD